MKLQPASPSSDRKELLAVAVATGLFGAEEAEELLGGILDGLAEDKLPVGHSALVCRSATDGRALGWTYFAPDQHAQGIWNVWWLGVSPAAQGTGVGSLLLRSAEARCVAEGARLIIIETSSTEPQARARRFYEKEGYLQCGHIPDFYGEGDDKVIYVRRPRPA